MDATTGELTYTPADEDLGHTVTIIYSVCNTQENPTVCASDTVFVKVETQVTGTLVMQSINERFTSEDGMNDSIQIALNTAPISDVVIAITGLDNTEGTLSKSELTFTPENWQATQSIIINGKDDDELDGNISYTLVLAVINESSDATFHDKSGEIIVTNIDNEVANNEPLAESDLNSMYTDEPEAVGNVLDNDSDEDGDPISVISFNASTDADEKATGHYGELAWTTDGAYSYQLDTLSEVVLMLGEGEELEEIFDYTIADTKNAESEATLTITIYGTAQVNELIIENALSPNGDGVNDVFEIENIEDYPDNELTIYNRWGTKIFSEKNYGNNWDGKSMQNNKLLPVGTYFYVVKLPDTKQPVKGYVYLKY